MKFKRGVFRAYFKSLPIGESVLKCCSWLSAWFASTSLTIGESVLKLKTDSKKWLLSVSPLRGECIEIPSRALCFVRGRKVSPHRESVLKIINIVEYRRKNMLSLHIKSISKCRKKIVERLWLGLLYIYMFVLILPSLFCLKKIK